MHVKEIALMANTAAGVHKERGKMKQVVEITIDLTDSNCKPRIEAFEITKVGWDNDMRYLWQEIKRPYEHGTGIWACLL